MTVRRVDQDTDVEGFRRFGEAVELLMWFFRVAKALQYNFKYRKWGTMSVIDYGCGRGEFLQILSRYQWNVLGVEHSRLSAQSALNKGLPVLIQQEYANLVIQNLQSESVKLITSFHNLEHLDDPFLFIQEAKRVLLCTGELVVEVPNFSSLQSRIARNSWILLDTKNHLFHFTAPGLTNLLRDSGFEVMKISTFSVQYGLYGMANALSLKLMSKLGHKPKIAHQFDVGFASSEWKSFYRILFAFFVIPASIIEVIASLFNEGSVLRIRAVPHCGTNGTFKGE